MTICGLHLSGFHSHKFYFSTRHQGGRSLKEKLLKNNVKIYSGKTKGVLIVGTLIGCAAFTYSVVNGLRNSLNTVTDVFETEKTSHSYIYIKDERDEVSKGRARKKFKFPFKIKKPWFPYLQSHSDDPWTLLRLAQSDDRSVRLLGVKSLAEEHYWSDAEFQMLAQTIDFRTLVGLARIENVNPRFFLPLPRIIPPESLEDELRTLLTSLPLDSIDKCTKYFTSSALQSEARAMSEERGGLWCFGGTGLAFASSLGPVPEEVVLTFCLQALIMHTRGTYWEVVQSGEFFRVRHEPTKSQLDMFTMQAILGHSQVASHCPEIVRKEGLKVLREMYETRRSSIKIMRSIARILSNLAMHQSLHFDIIRGGWVTILQHWLHSPDLALSLHAAKALANLDRDFGGSRLYPDGVYLYHPQYRYSEPIYADVVFVHGLLGGPFRTWRQKDQGQNMRKPATPPGNRTPSPPPAEPARNHGNAGKQEPGNHGDSNPSKAVVVKEEEERGLVTPEKYKDVPYTFCWPKDWLGKDCPNVRILTVEYETHLSEWAPRCPYESEKRTLDVRSGELLEKLRQSGLGSRPIIWVAHSMGGLLVKQMLLHAKDDPKLKRFVEETKGIVFYSVPHLGSPLAGYSNHTKYLLYPSVEVKELMQGSQQLSQIHKNFRDLMFDLGIPLLSFAEGQKTELPLNLKMLIVPPESSDPGFGEFHYMENLNHLNICKPAHKGEPLYQITLEFIRDCLPLHLVDKILKVNRSEEYVLPNDVTDR